MNFLAVGALILRSLGVVANNPALGGGSSLRLEELSELLGLFGQLFERGDEALEELRAFADIVEAMAKEGRPPSREEWAIMRGRSDAAHETIQDAANAAREDLRTEEERIADEEAETARQAIEKEIEELEAIPEEDLTDEQLDRLEELTSEEE